MKKTLSLVTLLAAGTSQAAGFALDTHSAKAVGMAVGVSTVEDSSAIYYNAANILGVQKLDVRLGDTPIVPTLQFQRDGGVVEKQKASVSPPFHVFAAYRFADKAVFGVGVYSPFGAAGTWEDDFSGRFHGLKSSVQTFNINPTLAYQLHERFRVGAGVQIMRATLDLTKDLDFVNSEGSARIAGAAWGVGGNVGVQAEVVEKMLSAGVHYRSPVKLSAKGQGDFQNIPLEFQSNLKDQNASATVTVPGQVSASLAFKPIERLTLAVEANWVQWSSFKEFSIEFEDASLNNPLPKRWKDTWNYHVGAQYGVTQDLNVRAGFVFDPSPSPGWSLTPDLPDASRDAVALGVGYAFGKLQADVGYQYVILKDKRSTAPGIAGTYSGNASVFAVTLGYSM